MDEKGGIIVKSRTVKHRLEIPFGMTVHYVYLASNFIDLNDSEYKKEKEGKRIFNEVDPFGEENWEV
jgi:hypothetical protein